MNVKEEDLIEYIKPLLKVQGFKKKSKAMDKSYGSFHIYILHSGKLL